MLTRKIIIFVAALTGLCIGVSYANNDTDGKYFFKDLFKGFDTVDDLNKTIKEKPESDEVLVKEGNFYFIAGTNLGKNDARKKEYLEKALSVFDSLWKKDRSNSKSMILLSYAYTAICDVEDNLEKILQYVFKARNMFTIVIQKFPENLDSRLGRIRININLTPQTGRPDDMLLDDALTYIRTYKKLDAGQKKDAYFYDGLAEACLAAVSIYDFRNENNNAKEYISQIDGKVIPAHLKNMYDKLKKKYGI
jgi:hypothetical protein